MCVCVCVFMAVGGITGEWDEGIWKADGTFIVCSMLDAQLPLHTVLQASVISKYSLLVTFRLQGWDHSNACHMLAGQRRVSCPSNEACRM